MTVKTKEAINYRYPAPFPKTKAKTSSQGIKTNIAGPAKYVWDINSRKECGWRISRENDEKWFSPYNFPHPQKPVLCIAQKPQEKSKRCKKIYDRCMQKTTRKKREFDGFPVQACQAHPRTGCLIPRIPRPPLPPKIWKALLFPTEMVKEIWRLIKK